MLGPLRIAHAACKGHAPENTLAGVRAALALGVDAIEIDLHASSDGVPVLTHDDSVDRTTDGSGQVARMSLAELQRLDAGRSFEGRFAGERIPTLAETLELTRDSCLLVMEIKQRGIEQAVFDVVRRHNASASVMVWSFHPEVVSAARSLAPEIPAAQLSGPLKGDPSALLNGAVRRNAQAISLYMSSVDAEFVCAARLRGLSVFTWTVDEPEEQARLAAAGVDGIVTNLPDVLAATLKKRRFDDGARPNATRARVTRSVGPGG